MPTRMKDITAFVIYSLGKSVRFIYLVPYFPGSSNSPPLVIIEGFKAEDADSTSQ